MDLRTIQAQGAPQLKEQEIRTEFCAALLRRADGGAMHACVCDPLGAPGAPPTPLQTLRPPPGWLHAPSCVSRRAGQPRLAGSYLQGLPPDAAAELAVGAAREAFCSASSVRDRAVKLVRCGQRGMHPVLARAGVGREGKGGAC